MKLLRCVCMSTLLFCATQLAADEYALHSFQRQRLTDIYYSEGIATGDIDGDGQPDVVHGPYWFAGPEFKQKAEIYPAKAQNRQAYADSFFSWVYDFNQDGANDVLAVGFPGTPAFVYENPGRDQLDKHWPKHQVFDWVSNESPHFTNIVGDERPELVCTRDGFFGFAMINEDKPLGEWKFHPISGQVATKRFGHGLGVGDIDGDGRLDLLTKDGWFQQPAELDDEKAWTFHAFSFTGAGGAEMYAYDVDGDGDNDVITSLQAHAFGLAWFEQLRDGDKITFRQHLIMGSKRSENRYGVLFTELHSVNLADVDGDGLKDIVTGKTYWSHHTKSPMWDAGAVVYWFKLVRREGEVDWLPYQADGEAGIGRQLVVADVNQDKLPDIVVGGMKGAHMLLHERQLVDAETWKAAQPQPPKPLAAGLEPAAAAKQMTVPAGFHVDLAAGEPNVHQPIAMAIDHRNRVWVAEAYTYPRRAPEGQGKDKIIILEDTNGDGRLNSRKVFAEGLNLVSGLEVGFGGVWVGAAPYLLFIPDRDGDDKPDAEPQVLLDGFGYQDTHETLNTFIWGPDGWLYGCHGVFTHSHVGKPGTPDEERTPMNAGVWRYHPTRHQFEVFAWGSSNPWGVDFDDDGQAFITACVIPHLYHVIQGARYQRQGGNHFNPHVYDDIKTIADHSHFVGNIRDHAWWGSEPTLPDDTSQAGGGHAHCGAMIYLGDNWPQAHRNQIFFNNIHGNRINNDLLQRQGSGFVGHHGKDLLMANDRWYRGINLRYAADGTVYLIDWYDKNACHRTNPEVWDRTNGRVYRIRYGQPESIRVDLSKLSHEELVELQLHKNDWYVRTARRLLQERVARAKQDDEGLAEFAPAIKSLKEIMTTHEDPRRQLRAMWALYAIDALSIGDCLNQSESEHEYVRAWSVQLLTARCLQGGGTLTRGARDRFLELAATDRSPVVRLYLASMLQRVPLELRWPIAEALIAHGEDVDDHNLPLMYWYAIEPLVAEDPAQAMQLAAESKIPLITRYVIRRASTEADSLDLVAAALVKSESVSQQQLILQEMLDAFRGRVGIKMPPSWTAAYEKLMKSSNTAVRETADQVAVLLGDKRIFPRMRSMLADDSIDLAKRQQALEILVRGRDSEAAASLLAAIDTAALRGPAIRALAAFNSGDISETLIANYNKFGEADQRDAIGTLVARPNYANALLDAIAEGSIPRTDLHAFHVRQLIGLEDVKLAARIKSVWGDIRESSADKLEQIAQRKKALGDLSGADRSHGRLLFNKTCATCHKLFGDGEIVGPDITGSNRANLDYILQNVIDPSAVLGKDYRMTTVATIDGRVISGLVKQETDSALTLRTINDTVVVAKADIEERRLSDKSLMPEGLLDQLKLNDIRDLIAYLGSPTQVSLRGPAAPIDPKTSKVPDAIEGETMKILSKTDGSARSQKMGNFRADRWSNADHLWWTGAKPGALLELELPVEKEGTFDLEIVLTKAIDYGIVQLLLDGKSLGGPIDLFNDPDVITTGVLTFPAQSLAKGQHRLGLQIRGTNPKAKPGFMVGLDYVRLVPSQR